MFRGQPRSNLLVLIGWCKSWWANEPLVWSWVLGSVNPMTIDYISMAFPYTKWHISMVRILSWSNHLPKLPPRSQEKHVGTLPVSFAQGIWAWKCQARSQKKKHRSKPPVGMERGFPGGRTRQVSNEGPGLLGTAIFFIKRCFTKLGAIGLVQEVDDKTIPSDASGLLETTN